MLESRIVKYLKSKKIVLFLGNGGVGKTTLSAATGILSAQNGLKTALVTIDPSQRLISALGLNNHERQQKINLNQSSELNVFFVVPKMEFADFLRSVDKTGKFLKIFEKNKLYQQMVDKLGETQNFSSLFLLANLINSNKYDLIILDTPPHKHAIDFLKTSNNIKKLVSQLPALNVKSSLLGKIFNTGLEVFLKTLDKLAGEDFSNELKDFLLTFPALGGELQKLSSDLEKSFYSTDTSINLVTTPDMARVVELKNMGNDMSGFNIENIWINRSLPEWLDESLVLDNKKSKWLLDAMTFYKQNLKYVETELGKNFSQINKVYVPETFGMSEGIGELVEFAKIIEKSF